MMVYVEYEIYKSRFRTAQMWFDDALLEKERLFTKTQPSAITYDRDIVQSSPSGDILDNYVISLEEKKINDKIEPFRQMLIDRERLLIIKEAELRRSPDKYDKIYVMKYLEGWSIGRICKQMNYSRSQVYKILDSITKKIRKI